MIINFVEFFFEVSYISMCFSFVTLCLGLSACNSSGHLSNHAEVAPSHAGITFAISNTLVSTGYFLNPLPNEIGGEYTGDSWSDGLSFGEMLCLKLLQQF